MNEGSAVVENASPPVYSDHRKLCPISPRTNPRIAPSKVSPPIQRLRLRLRLPANGPPASTLFPVRRPHRKYRKAPQTKNCALSNFSLSSLYLSLSVSLNATENRVQIVFFFLFLLHVGRCRAAFDVIYFIFFICPQLRNAMKLSSTSILLR